jgi:hypothetical protein
MDMVRTQNSEARSQKDGLGAGRWVLGLLLVTCHLSLVTALYAQQPQTSAAPVYAVNARYVNGAAPGYWATDGGGLSLDLSAGSAVCDNATVSYAGGSLSPTASETNYVYLDLANPCVPTSNTTGFTDTTIPVAKVGAGTSSVTSIAEARTFGFVGAGLVAQSQPAQFANLNSVRYVSGFAGANVGEKIAACVADLPANGGTCDARGLEGAQSITSDVLSGVARPVRVLLGATTLTLSHSVTVPDKVSIIGAGEETVIKKSNAITAGFDVKGTDVEIRGLRFEPQSVSGQPNCDIHLADGAANVRIEGNTFYAPFATVTAYSAICAAKDSKVGGSPYATPVFGTRIIDNAFQGYSRPVYLHSVVNTIISRNVFKDSNFDAIRLRENDGDTIIEANQFYNVGNPAWPDAQTRDAIDTYVSGHQLIIANNIVDTTAYHGFDLKGVNSTHSELTEQVIVTGNIIRNTRYSGISVSGDTHYDGRGTPYHTRFQDISHNQVYGCNQNNKQREGSVQYAGIFVRNTAKLSAVRDNIVAYCFGRGFNINAGVDPTEQSHNLMVTGNFAVNNGIPSASTVAGFAVVGVDGLVFKNNFAINDSDLPNPYQGYGIHLSSSTTASPVSHMQLVKDNVARGNLSYQIIVDTDNNRATGIASFRDNLQEGPGAIHRSSWQDQRALFHGDGSAPGSGDGEFRQGDLILNTGITATGFLGLVNTSGGSPGTWVHWGKMPSVSADNGDSDATLSVLTSARTQRWNTPLTANRTITLSTTNAQNGDRFRIVREAGATGASVLNVGTGPLKALAVSEWCEVEYDGAAWRLTAYGAL